MRNNRIDRDGSNSLYLAVGGLVLLALLFVFAYMLTNNRHRVTNITPAAGVTKPLSETVRDMDRDMNSSMHRLDQDMHQFKREMIDAERDIGKDLHLRPRAIDRPQQVDTEVEVIEID
jgi:hypothetical protein